MANRPATQIELTEELVRGLLITQHPEMADLRLVVLGRGFDNTNFRLGDEHLVRLPHRGEAAELLLNEQRWLGEIGRRLELSIPVPTHIGVPDTSYPWPWSITPWFPGDVAATSPTSDTRESATILGTFLRQLHTPASSNAPSNPHRGGPLAARRPAFVENLETLDIEAGKSALTEVFTEAALVAACHDNVWLHGDLHSRNMITNERRLTAVIDWGDICSGDPATDLAAAFMIVPHHLDVVKDLAGATEAAWARARGWAAHFAVLYVLYGDDDAVLAAMGHRLIKTLLETQ